MKANMPPKASPAKSGFKSERELLDEILLELKTLSQKLKQKNTSPAADDLLDNADVLLLLKITSQTAARWRKLGKLKFMKIGRKIYYKRKDVDDMILLPPAPKGGEDQPYCKLRSAQSPL